MEYDLVRSDRKTVAIYITKAARVEVRAPRRTPVSSLDAFVEQKSHWIEEKIGLLREKQAAQLHFDKRIGDTLLLCGREILLIGRAGTCVGYDGEVFYMPVDVPFSAAKPALVETYRRIAKQLISDRVAYYAPMVGVAPTAVKVNGAKTRWGSCSGRNSLNFSWYLVMANMATIDYVVVHELCHIREHNHSAAFWHEVERVLPDYAVQKTCLRSLQDRISSEAWE